MELDQRSRLSRITISGTIWTYISKYAGKPASLISTLLLVRLLSQEDFGMVAYALAVIRVLSPLSNLGLVSAMIYHRDEDTENTGFWMALSAAIALTALIWLVAPLADALFPDPRTIQVTCALALTIPLGGLGKVHTTLVQKRLSFSRQAPPTFVKSVAKGLISLTLAALGWGVWALVWGEIIAQVLWVAAYWIIIPWRPALRFNLRQARKILSYGLSMIAAGLFGSFMSNAHSFLLGQYLGAALLGVYSVALRIPDLAVADFARMQSKVLFPLYAQFQEDLKTLGEVFTQTLQQVSFFTVPAGLGLAIIAKPFVAVFFTPEWTQVVPVMQALAIYTLVMSFERLGGVLLRAQGRVRVFLQLTVLRAALLLPGLWWAAAIQRSLVAVALVYGLVSLFSSLVHLWLVGRLLQVGVGGLLAAVRPAWICGGLMCLAALTALDLTSDAPLVAQLAAAILSGAIVYALASWWMQRETSAQLFQALAAFFHIPPRPLSPSNDLHQGS